MDQFNFDSFPSTNFNETNLDWLLSLVQQLTELVESGRYGVPAGGSTGQVLGKLGPDDFQTGWIDQTGGGGTSNYAQLTNKPQINGVELLGNKTAAQLNLVAAQAGKGLSSNDYTDADKALLSSLFFADRSTTYAELDAAFSAGKKMFFMDAGEIFPCLEKTSTQFRFLTLRSSGGIRQATLSSSGSWSVSTSANPGSYVKYTSMSLSDAQKQQARTNIGAIGVSDYNPDAKTDAMTQPVGKDNNGKLWTTPGGGGSSDVWEQIYLGVLSEDGTNKWYVDQDMNGNPFELSKIIVRCKCVAAADNSAQGYGKIFVNVASDFNPANPANRIVNVVGYFRPAGQVSTMMYYGELIMGDVLIESLYKGDTAAIDNTGAITGNMPRRSGSELGVIGETTNSITSIMVGTDAVAKFGSGSVLAIYGVRA